MDIKAVKRKVVKQLVEGYEFASRLHQLLLDPTRILFGSGSGPTDELMAKILGSFDRTISVLGSVAEPVEGSRNTSSGESPAAVPDGRCEDSGDSRKSRSRPLSGINKGKRGCYKRKRKSQSWTVESNTVEDTHAWRKYGQKDILNAKHPRSYFRCSNKYTHGCKAIKQVQKLELDPGLFQITYIGTHTCNNNQTKMVQSSSEIVADSENTCGSSSCVVISRGGRDDLDNDQLSKAKPQDVDNMYMSSSVSDIAKEEEYNVNLSLVWQDFMSFDDEPVYCCGETYRSGGCGGDDVDPMVFGSSDFVFGDHD